jgi:hypothetical protein
MLGFFSNKSDHPLADFKSAQQLLDDLPKTDPVQVLDEIGHWIEALFDPENAFRLDHQFAVLRMLDEAALPYLRKIINSYFAVVAPASFQENRFWAAMNGYYTFTESAYVQLANGLQDGEKGSSGIRSQTALICARGIYAAYGRMECAAVKYAQIDSQLWAHLAAFYALAEAEHCQDEMFPLYSGMKVNTSVQHLLASVLMWYSVGVGAFKPLDLHIAKCLMIYMCQSFLVSDHAEADSQFVFDLEKSAAPVRVTDEGAMYPTSTRFVSIGGAPQHLDNLIKTLAKNLVPEELNFGVAYSAEMMTDVVRRLAGFCQSTSPMRRHPRRKINIGVNVLNGFFKVIEKTNTGLSIGDASSESWNVEDMSATGMRCVLPPGHGAGVKIGTLIGLQPEKAEHWGVGVVRRLRRDEKNNLHIGVRILANKVLNVVVNDTEGGSADPEHTALLLDRTDEQGSESWMLMKADTFSINRSPTMKLGDQSYLLMPLALVEKGEDFDLVRYRKMAQDTGGEDAY